MKPILSLPYPRPLSPFTLSAHAFSFLLFGLVLPCVVCRADLLSTVLSYVPPGCLGTETTKDLLCAALDKLEV